MRKNILQKEAFSTIGMNYGDKFKCLAPLEKRRYFRFQNIPRNYTVFALPQSRILTEQSPQQRKAEVKISHIKDPLWKRICTDILKVLGPIAFQDLWRINLLTVPPGGKTAELICPNKLIAEKVERYHFVLIGALKQFYPFLLFVEAKIRGPKKTKK